MSESESEESDAVFKWDAEKKCLVTVPKEVEPESDSTDIDDVCVDMASTPELLLKAKAAGEPMLSQLANKWVIDEQTNLSFLLHVEENRIYCWNPELQYLYEWKGRGKLTFLQAGAPQQAPTRSAAVTADPSTAAGPSNEASASAPSSAPAADSNLPTLFVTVVPPHILRIDTNDVERRIERTKNVQLVEQECTSLFENISTHTKVRIRQVGRTLVLRGRAAGITQAMSLFDQACVKVLGAAKAEKIKRSHEQQHIEWLKGQTVGDAAKNCIPGIAAWAEKWELPAGSIRQLKKCDAMLQRFVMRHFSPMRATPKNALRAFVDRLHKGQSWRLQALVTDRHLETECDTYVVDDKVVGTNNGGIQLEGDAKEFGDVQATHSRFFSNGNDWYVMALESKIGTIVDGVKLREADGPHNLRDRSVVVIGKYLLLCEIGDPAWLYKRRADYLGVPSFGCDFEEAALELDEITKGGNGEKKRALSSDSESESNGSEKKSRVDAPEAIFRET